MFVHSHAETHLLLIRCKCLADVGYPVYQLWTRDLLCICEIRFLDKSKWEWSHDLRAVIRAGPWPQSKFVHGAWVSRLIDSIKLIILIDNERWVSIRFSGWKMWFDLRKRSVWLLHEGQCGMCLVLLATGHMDRSSPRCSTTDPTQ